MNKRKANFKQDGNHRSAFIRIEQVQGLLDNLLTFEQPADVVLSGWMRSNRRAGARDRSQVANASFDVVRNLRRYRNIAESGQGPMNRRLALLGIAATVGLPFLQSALANEEFKWLESVLAINPEHLSEPIRYSVPEWLYSQIQNMENASQLLNALNQAAPLDIRVNPFKTTREEVLSQLSNESFNSLNPVATQYSPWGIRLQGRPPVNRWALFEQGQIEVQDEGSQLLAALVAPRRGEMVIDYCAGAGGKTLLLGALMRSTGRLYAFDVSAARLARAKPRFARSGLSNIVPVVIQPQNDKRVQRLRGKADRVLVDAPCTGLGTLRRNPDLKWRTNAESLQGLLKEQASILDQAAQCVKTGGRLIYATCSILDSENRQQVHGFLSRNPGFELLDAGTILANSCPSLKVNDSFLELRPDYHGTDGFFAAVLQRT